MEQVLAIVFVALLIYFIWKVGSVLWRIAGVLFFLFLIYTFKDELLTQLRHFMTSPNLGGWWQSIVQFFKDILDTVIAK